MNYKPWVCKLGGREYNKKADWPEISLEILIRAMFAINRGSKWAVYIYDDCIYSRCRSDARLDCSFAYPGINNSELEALEAALKYIFKKTKGLVK